jgi:hypothetical protein
LQPNFLPFDPKKYHPHPEILGTEGKSLPRDGEKLPRKRELFLFFRLGNDFDGGNPRSEREISFSHSYLAVAARPMFKA